MLFDTNELDQYTKVHTVFDESMLNYLPLEVVSQAAKFQVEFYFGQSNYYKDDHLKSCADKEGWIPLETIYEFRKLKKFHSRLSLDELAYALNLSTVVDVGQIDRFRDGNDIQFYVKKKDLLFKDKYSDFFGYDVEKIKQLTKE